MAREFSRKKVLMIARKMYGETPKITPSHGENNFVFRLKFKNFERFIKIDGIKQGKPWVIEKEMYLFDLARKHGIPTPEVEFYDLTGKIIKKHWMIMRSLGHHNLDQLFSQGKDVRKLFFEMGRLLAKMHGIKLKRQGTIYPDRIENQPFYEFTKNKFETDLSTLLRLKRISKAEAEKAREVFKDFKDSKESRLCHYDFGPSQVMTDGRRISGIIDWEWAKSSDPVYDYAKAELVMELWSGNIGAFKNGYESIKKLPNDYGIISHPYKLLESIKLMVFFKNRREPFSKVRKVFLHLIQKSVGNAKRVGKMLWVSNPVDLIIINKKNQILLVKRLEEEEGFNDTWSIPGGGPEVGEDFESALHRKIMEELNCKIKRYEYFRSYYMNLPKEHHVRSVYFYGEINGKIKINEESSEYRWFDLSDPELLKLKFAFNQQQVISDFVRFWKRRKKNWKF